MVQVNEDLKNECNKVITVRSGNKRRKCIHRMEREDFKRIFTNEVLKEISIKNRIQFTQSCYEHRRFPYDHICALARRTRHIWGQVIVIANFYTRQNPRDNLQYFFYFDGVVHNSFANDTMAYNFSKDEYERALKSLIEQNLMSYKHKNYLDFFGEFLPRCGCSYEDCSDFACFVR